MITSIQDYENWRDSLYDRPQPDPEPDELQTVRYTHDYPNDTSLTYSRSGNESTLRLSFTSEDPDMGTEELLYHGENGESMQELVVDLLSEITGYLDAQDTSSFHQQQGDGIHSLDDMYNEYSRTALYAFEGMLKEKKFDLQVKRPMEWMPLEPEKVPWIFGSLNNTDQERGCIGHLRGDFGRDGDEFWTSWFDHLPNLKSQDFRNELQDVVNTLRKPGGLLHDFQTMRKECSSGREVERGYGFRAESPHYEYCMRCIPTRGDYNFYIFCYDKDAQREYARKPSLRDQLKAAVPEKPTHTNNKKEIER